MSYVAKGDKEFEASGATPVKSHKIRITLTSRNVKNLEKGEPKQLTACGQFMMVPAVNTLFDRCQSART